MTSIQWQNWILTCAVLLGLGITSVRANEEIVPIPAPPLSALIPMTPPALAISSAPAARFEALSASEISNTGRLRISFKLNGVLRGTRGATIHFTLRDTEGNKLAEMRGHAHASVKQAIEWQALAGTKNSPEGIYLLVAEVGSVHCVQPLPLGI